MPWEKWMFNQQLCCGNLGGWWKVQYVTQTQNIGVIKIKCFQKIVGSLFLSCSKKEKDAFCFCPQGSFTPIQCPGLGSCSPIWVPVFQEGGCLRVKGEKAAAIKQHQLWKLGPITWVLERILEPMETKFTALFRLHTLITLLLSVCTLKLTQTMHYSTTIFKSRHLKSTNLKNV